MWRQHDDAPLLVQELLQVFKPVDRQGLVNLFFGAEPQQTAIDDRLGKQLKMPSQPRLAVLWRALRERQCELGAHDVRTRTHQARCEPAQSACPATARAKAAAPEIREQGAQERKLVDHAVGWLGSGGASSGTL